MFDGKPQYLSSFEVRWRHPKFQALLLAHRWNCWDSDCYSCLLALRGAATPSSLENHSVKPSVTEVHGSPTIRPTKGLCTSTLKVIPIEYVYSWDDAGWQMLFIFTLPLLQQPPRWWSPERSTCSGTAVRPVAASCKLSLSQATLVAGKVSAYCHAVPSKCCWNGT